MANLKNTTISDTGFLQLPVGTTAQRPTPIAGQMRFNTSLGRAEFYNATQAAWKPTINQGVIATGGTVYDVDVEGTTYRVHVFTATGTSTFSVLQGGEAEYLIVAGGGGGGRGSNYGGGGGAGGLVSGKSNISPGNFDVTVGNGGAGASSRPSRGENGSNSSISSVAAVAIGGGGGGAQRDIPEGKDGGSGGGAGWNNPPASGGSGVSGQGNDGGSGNTSPNAGGGGGGAGETPNSVSPTDGGIGLSTSIAGNYTFYAGGGGGSNQQESSGGGDIPEGGLGGGGRGMIYNEDGQNTSGVPNTGGGGGAGGNADTGKDGGSGIVIIRYPLRQENPEVAAGKTVGDALVLDLDFAKPTVYSGSGSVVSDSRLSRQGDIVGSLSYENPRTHRAFFDFSASASIITFDNFTEYTDKITVEVISRIRETGPFQRIVSKHDDTTSATTPRSCFQLQNTNDGGFRWSLNNTSGDYFNLDSNIIPPLDQIYHFVGTYDGATMKIFVDGTEIDSRSASGDIRQSSQPLVIGAERTSDGSTPYEYSGDLFVARVYNIALSAEQIQQNFDFFRWRFGL